eukprot:100728-Pyramimonas_sp.AAC.1
MDKALSPYVKGGGAKKYEEELKKMYGFDDTGAIGGFQEFVGRVYFSEPLNYEPKECSLIHL